MSPSQHDWNRSFLSHQEEDRDLCAQKTLMLNLCLVSALVFNIIQTWFLHNSCVKGFNKLSEKETEITNSSVDVAVLEQCPAELELNNRGEVTAHGTLSAPVVFYSCERERFCCQGAGLCFYLSKQNLINTRYQKKVYCQPEHAVSTFISTVINFLCVLTHWTASGWGVLSLWQPASTPVVLMGSAISTVSQQHHKPS